MTMSDGTRKNINKIAPGSYIVDKFGKSLKVRRVNVYPSQVCVQLQLDNGTGIFYASSDVLVNSTSPGNTTVAKKTFKEIYNEDYRIKMCKKTYSDKNGTRIILFNESETPRTLYSLDVSGGNTFKIQNFIAPV